MGFRDRTSTDAALYDCEVNKSSINMNALRSKLNGAPRTDGGSLTSSSRTATP
jgi:hypothetical protein